MKPKDFQKKTADRIVEIFKTGQNRILLADEVGLGKTIIAREVVNQVSEWHRLEDDDHFKVIYICSNINIANQNAKKLEIKDLMDVSESRLSMQHLKIYQTKGRDHDYEQLIPLTPATSFTMKSGCGNQAERALMYAHLKRLDTFASYTDELSELLKFEAGKYWTEIVECYEKRVVECDGNGSDYIAEMNKELKKRLASEVDLVNQIIEHLRGEQSKNKYEIRKIINRLRKIFAQISLDKLEPDLVIMDEFQRFRDLISPDDDEQGMLSRQFLSNTNTKVLLLSATPYKPYSTLEEISFDEDTDHYREFMEVMEFLFYKPETIQTFKKVWQDYSTTLSELTSAELSVLRISKNRAEDALYEGVCRTERFSSGIVDDCQAKEIEITSSDILSFSDMKTLVDVIKSDQHGRKIHDVPIDYVKSSPYLLSFMENYQLKKQIVNYFSSKKSYDAVKGSKSKRLLLKKSSIHNYQEIESNNARLELLKDMVFNGGKNGVENLLWIPPSRPYYQTGSVFDKNKNYSKMLVFSAWEMVTRMISVMLSYESERITIGKLFHNARLKRGRGYFTSKEDKRYGISRLKNETEQIICYPSKFLAELYHPANHIDKTIKQIRNEIAETLRPKLDALQNKHGLETSGNAGAKVIIEVLKALDDPNVVPTAFPENTLEILTNMAIGSPGICALRLLSGVDKDKQNAERLAKEVFVSLFNKAEASAILDLLYSRKSEDHYYENVFKYCVDGNLQAVLDEYAHMLNESGDKLVEEIIESMSDTSSLQLDTLESFIGIEKEKPRIRTHFAVGYFNSRLSTENVQRTETLRKAFNSPFRPFVLSTTSIGQEGLDFHYYCRKVMHWNLPSNPIDLEQREGRINRFKCHAVRQNVAHKYGDVLNWDAMFDKASKAEKGAFPDLVPYWNLADLTNTAVKIERIVPMYPLSQDRIRYDRLIRVLSLYRLTLGQPRQEELIEILNREIENQIDDELFINLSPFYRERIKAYEPNSEDKNSFE